MNISLSLLAQLATSAQRCSALSYYRSIDCRLALVNFDPKQHTRYHAGFDLRGRITAKASEHAERGRQEAEDARSLLFELIDRKAKVLRVFSHFPEDRWVYVREWLNAFGRTQAVNCDGDYFTADGTFMNADGTRSIFDDVDE